MQALDPSQGDARRQLDGDIDVLAGRGHPLRRRRSTAHGIDDGGIRGGERRRRIEAGPGRVARRDGERQSQRIARVSIGNRLQVRDLNRQRRVGRDIGHRGGEHVGTLLVHDARPLPLAAGLRIVRLRLRLFLNVPADGALTDVHEQFIDRRIRGEREHVQALHPIAAGVRELLNDVHPRDVAGDLRLHGRCDPQRLHRLGVRRGLQIQGAGLDLG